jgi:integrase/recombinase XerC
MALALYRRHPRDCKTDHSEELRTSEYDERKKGWRRCECPIFISGTLKGTFKRRNAGTWEWDNARQLAVRLEEVGSWTGQVTAPAPSSAPEAPRQQTRITIAAAVKVFLSSREGAKIARSTLRNYRSFTNQLTAFADRLGYLMLDQLTSGDIDLFYSQMQLGSRTKAKRLGTLRAFFRFCVNRKWLPESPVSADIKPPVGANRVANKAPFADLELQRIISACDRMPDVVWSSGNGGGRWTGEDIKDFVWTMIYTGLRISDVALFNMNRLNGNEVFLRAQKNGGEVFAYIPDWLRERLTARAGRCSSRPFLVGQSERLETVTDLRRRKINSVFELAGRFEERPTPHRFRHPFARILLQRGVPVADVADLLGDDEKTVREHYARWVPERQARLTRILKEAFDDKPKGNLVVM